MINIRTNISEMNSSFLVVQGNAVDTLMEAVISVMRLDDFFLDHGEDGDQELFETLVTDYFAKKHLTQNYNKEEDIELDEIIDKIKKYIEKE